jgi:hypothetical protein
MGVVYGDALPLSGTIDLLQVHSHIGVVTLGKDLVSLCTTSFINPYELAHRKPSGNPPHDLLSFRGYRHKAISVVDSLNFLYAGGSQDIIIGLSGIRSTEISVSKNQSWISVSYNSTYKRVTVTVSQNYDAFARFGSVTISGGGLSCGVLINQSADEGSGGIK